MLATLLPFEILAMTASFMTQRQRFTCTTVCKSWSKAFQHSLWYSIEIVSEEKVVAILNPPITQENAYKNNGNRVRDLTLKSSLLLTNEQLSQLQSYFQKLLIFRAGFGSLDPDVLNTTSNWKNWSSLVELKMAIMCMDKNEPEDKLFELLVLLPNLKRLDFTEYCTKDTHYYTWETLEDIHCVLPKLESLSLDIRLISTPLDNIKMMINISPASRLRFLELRRHIMNFGWLYYISLKYPNIESILSSPKLGVRMPDLSVSDNETMMLLKNNTHVLSHLNKVDITHDIASRDSFQLLCVIYKDLFKSVSNLKCNVEVSGDLLENPVTVGVELMNSFPASLESLHIEITSPGCLESYKLPAFQIFPHLKYLRINIFNSTVNIDKILDSFPSLTHLHMKGEFITLSSPYARTEKLHGLRNLQLQDAIADSVIFKYISYRCRDLVVMLLYDLDIVEKNSTKAYKVYMDMSYTHFQSLLFNQVRFFVTTETGSFDEDSPTNLFVVERLVRFPQYNNPNLREIPEFYKRIPGPDGTMIWAHFYHDKEDIYKPRKMSILSYKDGQAIKKSFASNIIVPENPETVHSRRKRYSGGLVLQRFWRSDIPKGCARMRCGYVRLYYIDRVCVNIEAKEI
ncbi:hypothetical protein J3Q64DRAFT_1708592 [Phycomyces blakesleeanus]|uniref:F-box domain-containing protein n=2 Tax=Phycomyces blakesleeanus TaxID=4837 RepID=A0A162UP97_PHYB8|nr:hypothetical protein PHYBLDRAFT_141158 [Phycomyces blakesleeanus NRRL 1555(-)]OAD77272.1 hypothetical protein PHYBLDRAFT_141158 [Phycomyces blakesleeanus NRRL 1555(-)]|eukprot:XP_018295312.1 hypothetical protein PHYBLDRAFT_141158 [Phycomyces blakesleeanus NRRL 1555(-)]